MQLHPHFLFNTLNAVVGLMRNNENQAAISMTVGLGELLRHTLENAGKQEVPLSEEGHEEIIYFLPSCLLVPFGAPG